MLLLTNSKQEIVGLEGFDLKVIGKKVSKMQKNNVLIIASNYYQKFMITY